MRIVNKEEFLNLPKNTIYQKYAPGYLGDICIKLETFHQVDERSFFYKNLTNSVGSTDSVDFLEKLSDLEKGEHLSANFSIGEEEWPTPDSQLFVVWSNMDVSELIIALEKVFEREVKKLEDQYTKGKKK